MDKLSEQHTSFKDVPGCQQFNDKLSKIHMLLFPWSWVFDIDSSWITELLIKTQNNSLL